MLTALIHASYWRIMPQDQIRPNHKKKREKFYSFWKKPPIRFTHNYYRFMFIQIYYFLVRSAPIDIRPTRKSRRRTLSSSASTKPTFSSQYEIDGAVLGEGAYGSVYKCTHRIMEVEYAVKIIYKKLGQAGKRGKEKVTKWPLHSDDYISHVTDISFLKIKLFSFIFYLFSLT